MLRQMIQNILVYVVMINLLRELVAEKGFREIFRFVSGLLLILLCLTPVVSEITDSNALEKVLRGKLFEADVAQIQQEAALAEGNFTDILQQECAKMLEEQIRTLTGEAGEEAEGVDVSVETDADGTLSVAAVEVSLVGDAKQAMAQEDGKIADIVIQRTDSSGLAEEKEQDGNTRKLQKQICDALELSEKKVVVWRKNGNNG